MSNKQDLKVKALSKEEESEAIKRRLVVKEVTLKKVVRSYVAWTEALEKEPRNEQDIFNAKQQFLQDLDAQHFLLEKLAAVGDSCDAELSNYALLYASKEREIEEVRRAIVDGMAELEHERITRNRKEEYTALARVVDELPNRMLIQKEINELEADIASLEKRGGDIGAKLEHRTRQFQLLLHTVGELQRDLNNETDESTTVAPMDE